MTAQTDCLTELYKPKSRMNAASVVRSARLKSVMGYLSDRQWHSTRDIIQATGMCAINSIIAELRVNGLHVECKYHGKTSEGNSIYKYRWAA